jgi:hypothetical protein
MIRENELRIFDEFQALCPDFAGGAVVCGAGADPPDILCEAGGVRIGVELGEWLDEWQIGYRKREERQNDSYDLTFEIARTVKLSNLSEVWIEPIKTLETTSRDQFNKEFFKFILKLDQTWQDREDYNDPQGVEISTDEFVGFPALTEHLTELECYSVTRPMPASEWLNMLSCGSAYDPKDAADALITLLRKKCAKYNNLHNTQKLAELYLVLYYEQAMLYNSPYEGLSYGFSDVADALAIACASEHGYFDRIFLFDSVNRLQALVWANTGTLPS